MDSRSGWFCLGGPVFNAARPAPSPSAPVQRPTGVDFFLTKAYDHVGVCRDAAQYPRRHGSRPVLCACRTGRRAGDVGGCNGIGPRNGPSKFSIGRSNFPSLAARRLVGHPVVRIRGALRDCRTDWRPIGGFNRWFGDAIDALVPFLCRRRDDLCCGGGTYSGSTPRRTFPPRDGGRHAWFPGDDDFRRSARLRSP